MKSLVHGLALAPLFVLGLTTATLAQLPHVNIADLWVVEGDAFQADAGAGSHDAVLTVRLSAAASYVVSVDYATENEGATGGKVSCGGSVDYIIERGTVRFNPGQTSHAVGVALCKDIADENDEVFRVELSNPVGATIQDQTGRVTIVDDDVSAPALPTISIGDVTVVEPRTAQAPAVFTVTLSGATRQSVMVQFATAPNTANTSTSCGVASSDFLTRSGRLLFIPGTTTQRIEVPVCADSSKESLETFTVTLSSPVNATIASAEGTATIR